MALWLSAVEGLSYAEVAEALDTTDKSVKSLVHRARATLAERLPAPAPLPVKREEDESGKRDEKEATR